MNKLFEIKYSIFEDDKEKFKSMSLEEFEDEFTNIYGMFTIISDGNKFIQYLDEENKFLLETRRMFSELINVYFDGLIYIVNHLDEYPLFYLKYIENRTTWLEVLVEEKEILISEVERDWTHEMNNGLDCIVTTQSKLFNIRTYKTWGNIRIEKEKFKSELNEKLFLFLCEIKSQNQSILKSKIFNEQIIYLYDNGIDILANW